MVPKTIVFQVADGGGSPGRDGLEAKSPVT